MTRRFMRAGRAGQTLGQWALIALVAGLATVPSASAGLLDKGKEALKGLSGEQHSGAGQLSSGEVAAGLKEALRVGTDNVVAQLGRAGGFKDDPAIHIPLPQSLSTVQKTLGKVGGASLLDELEARLNRAAEIATPKAQKLFVNAIQDMSLDDAKAIYRGPKDAATRYFEKRTSEPLAQEMRPVVDDSLSEAGALQAYDKVMSRYRNVPFVPDVKANLNDYVVDKGMDGIFHYLAQQEAAIRENPTKRSTALLKRVFGGG